jgi:chitodextrinase
MRLAIIKRWYPTAPHRSASWRFFLTRQGWTLGATLRCPDLELVSQWLTQLQVYALNTNSGLQFAVDKTVPNTSPGQTSTPAWAEGQNYAVGQLVTYNGRLYCCRVAHTAWPNASWWLDVAWVLSSFWVAL